MLLIFKPLGFNDEFTIDIIDPQTETVRDLYYRVKAHYEMDFTKVALICKGKDLWPDNTLSSYEVIQD